MIVVGSVLAPWKCDGTELSWLAHPDTFVADAADAGIPLEFFAALEVDARGTAPYPTALFQKLDKWWTFSVDDGATEVTTANRLRRICTGRNLIIERAMEAGAEWVLFLDSDLTPDPRSVAKLLDMDWPIVGGDVPSYCLGGELVANWTYPVEKHWNTAGYLLVHRRVFSQIRWRTDLSVGLTDDPAFAADANRLGYPTFVRKDCVGTHAPLIPVEARSVDRRIHRG